jgi:proteasome lid subunit RPN8/RPN11
VNDDDIEFGKVEQAAPTRALRPDEDRRFAVLPYDEPRDNELPIFVDLDVLADMEQHALSDTSVELGGVLLGGRYVDADGRPFVVISESLRARHYESTRGSFKFTHETWSAITRQRQQLPPELQMAGWYHTHPDWGVFLSGMDLFICDHFFRHPLDVAYVIDPCRGDRGMFQWTDNGNDQDQRERVRRTGGFFVTASRSRAAELENFVAELSKTMSPTSTRVPAGSYPAPVVHLHQPHGDAPPWQTIAALGALMLQCLLVALIAWRVFSPAAADSDIDSKVAAALDKLNTSLATAEARHRADVAEARTRARAEFLDEAFRELKSADNGAISRLQTRFDQSGKLAEDVAARDAQIRELRATIDETRGKLQTLEASAKREEQRLTSLAEKLKSENSRLQSDLKKKDAELALFAGGEEPIAANGGRAEPFSMPRAWWWLAVGAAAIVAVGAGCWWIVRRGGLAMPAVNESAALKPTE